VNGRVTHLRERTKKALISAPDKIEKDQ